LNPHLISSIVKSLGRSIFPCFSSSTRAKNMEIPWLGIFRKACMPYQIEVNSNIAFYPYSRHQKSLLRYRSPFASSIFEPSFIRVDTKAIFSDIRSRCLHACTSLFFYFLLSLQLFWQSLKWPFLSAYLILSQ
jgi:hypothetical protein